jgi:hypothetical protein
MIHFRTFSSIFVNLCQFPYISVPCRQFTPIPVHFRTFDILASQVPDAVVEQRPAIKAPHFHIMRPW